jgi:hypothetical protein
MRAGNILFSAAHLFVIVSIFSLGALFFALPYAESLRFYLVYYLYEEPQTVLVIGGGCLIFGLLLLIGFYRLNRSQFLTIKMDRFELEIDPLVVRGSVQNFWKNAYPFEKGVVDVVVQKEKKMEILLHMPKGWEDSLEENLFKLQKALGRHLSKELGYGDEFYVTFIT